MCISLLQDESLIPDHDIFWVTAFAIIKKILTGVDYKGVREIMKVQYDVFVDPFHELKVKI